MFGLSNDSASVFTRIRFLLIRSVCRSKSRSAISSDYKTITKGDVESIGTDADDDVTYSIDSNTKTLKKVFIKVNDPSSLYSITLPAGVEVYGTSSYVSYKDGLQKDDTVYVRATDPAKVPVIAGVTLTPAHFETNGTRNYTFKMPNHNIVAADVSTASAGYAVTASIALGDPTSAADKNKLTATATPNDKIPTSGATVTYAYQWFKIISVGAWVKDNANAELGFHPQLA